VQLAPDIEAQPRMTKTQGKTQHRREGQIASRSANVTTEGGVWIDLAPPSSK
jgi:hypothetical protein